MAALYYLIIIIFNFFFLQTQAKVCRFVNAGGTDISTSNVDVLERTPIGTTVTTLTVEHDANEDITITLKKPFFKNNFKINKNVISITKTSFDLIVDNKLDLSASTLPSMFEKIPCPTVLSTFLELTLNVIDVNDPPICNLGGIHVNYMLDEFFPLDLEFTKLFPTNFYCWDLDTDSIYNSLQFSIWEYDTSAGLKESQMFGAKSVKLPIVSNYSVNLFLKENLNYKQKSKHEIFLKAEDISSTNPLSTTIAITVDVKENNLFGVSPVFNEKIYKVSINTKEISASSTLPKDLTVHPSNIKATISDGSSINYEIDQDKSVHPKCFSLDNSGMLSLTNIQPLLDERVIQTFLTIKAVSSDTKNKNIDTAVVEVNLSYPPKFPIKNHILHLSRDTPPGTLLWTVSAGQFVNYFLTDTTYVIEKNTGVIKVENSLEKETSRTLSIVAKGISGDEDTFQLEIIILEDPKPPPVFECSIPENKIRGSCDGLKLDKNAIYKIKEGNNDNKFEISNGILTCTTSLDYEKESKYFLLVLNHDTKEVFYIKVMVQDVNEPPVWPNGSKGQIIGVPPWIQLGQIIATFQATDSDHDSNNAEISYGLTIEDGKQEEFYQNDVSGDLNLIRKLSQNITEGYVTATDKGTPPLSSPLKIKILSLTDDNIFSLNLPNDGKDQNANAVVLLSKLKNILKVDIGLLFWRPAIEKSSLFYASADSLVQFYMFALKEKKILPYSEIDQLVQIASADLNADIGPYTIQPHKEQSSEITSTSTSVTSTDKVKTSTDTITDVITSATTLPDEENTKESNSEKLHKPEDLLIAVIVLAVILSAMILSLIGILLFKRCSSMKNHRSTSTNNLLKLDEENMDGNCNSKSLKSEENTPSNTKKELNELHTSQGIGKKNEILEHAYATIQDEIVAEETVLENSDEFMQDNIFALSDNPPNNADDNSENISLKPEIPEKNAINSEYDPPDYDITDKEDNVNVQSMENIIYDTSDCEEREKDTAVTNNDLNQDEIVTDMDDEIVIDMDDKISRKQSIVKFNDQPEIITDSDNILPDTSIVTFNDEPEIIDISTAL